MTNPYDGWLKHDEQVQRRHNRERLLPRVSDDELIAELNRRGYEVAWTDPEHGMQHGARPTR